MTISKVRTCVGVDEYDEICGVEIPAKRLVAMPNARYCIKCQERIDAKSESDLLAQQDYDNETIGSLWGSNQRMRTVIYLRNIRRHKQDDISI